MQKNLEGYIISNGQFQHNSPAGSIIKTNPRSPGPLTPATG